MDSYKNINNCQFTKGKGMLNLKLIRGLATIHKALVKLPQATFLIPGKLFTQNDFTKFLFMNNRQNPVFEKYK